MGEGVGVGDRGGVGGGGHAGLVRRLQVAPVHRHLQPAVLAAAAAGQAALGAHGLLRRGHWGDERIYK